MRWFALFACLRAPREAPLLLRVMSQPANQPHTRPRLQKISANLYYNTQSPACLNFLLFLRHKCVCRYTFRQSYSTSPNLAYPGDWSSARSHSTRSTRLSLLFAFCALEIQCQQYNRQTSKTAPLEGSRAPSRATIQNASERAKRGERQARASCTCTSRA